MTTVSGVMGGGQPTMPTSTQAGIGDEFNSFIKLLTAQVRNQDPLSPMDSTQFVEQLATFSSLEQQVRSNQALTSIAAMMTQLNALAASEWLGQTVSFAADWAPYIGEPVEFSVAPPDGTDEVKFSVRDSSGTVLWTETLDMDKATHKWNGAMTEGGIVAKDKMYEFVIETYQDGQMTGKTTPRLISTVTDVITEEGLLRVGTASGVAVDLGKVRKL